MAEVDDRALPEFDDMEHGLLRQSVMDMIRCPDKIFAYEEDTAQLVKHLEEAGIAKTSKDAVATYIQLDSMAKARDWLVINAERS